jgi:hypothetical protein
MISIKSFMIVGSYLFAASSAGAAELPKYDIDLHCKATTAIFASSQDFMMKACRESEEKSAKQIGSRLDRFSPETLARCDALAQTATGGSYQSFAGCLVLDIADRFLNGKIDIVTTPK